MVGVSSTSQALMWIASSNLKKPAKERRLNVEILRLASVGLASASLAISARISVGIAFLFCTGLDHVLFRPCMVSCTMGLLVGDWRPANPCTHEMAFTAASAAETDSRRSPIL